MTHTRKKLLVFHQALAPYRVDFWNTLNDHFNAEIYFIYDNLLDQKFDQETLKSMLTFQPHYLKKGFRIGTRAFRWGFISILRRFQPDIVFTYEYSQTTLFLCVIKKIFGFKYKIYSVCDDSLDIAENCKGIREILRNFLVNKIDGLILLNKEVAAWYGSKFKDNDENSWIIFPITYRETEFRAKLAYSLTRSNVLIRENNLIGTKCVFFVGRLVAVKGIDRLIKAFNIVSKEMPDALLILIGDGDDRDKLYNIAAGLGIESKVLFKGRLEGTELFAWYNIGQIFVLTSHHEPFGAVVNEALLAGAFVLCSAVAGSSSLIIPGINGNLFNPFDISSLGLMLENELNNIAPISELSNIRASNSPVDFDQMMNDLIEVLNM